MTFDSFASVLEKANSCDMPIWQTVQNEEAAILDISVIEYRQKVFDIYLTMKASIKEGIAADELSKSGLSGSNSRKILNYYSKKPLSLLSEVGQKVLLYSAAVIEQNAKMGKIAACPTAGSSGIVAGVICALCEYFNFSDDSSVNALITAGVTGEIISNKVALSGAVAGCQAECGAASSMAAAAACYLMGGCNNSIINAAALSLKNLLGLTCDPVAGLVEVPCVKRNSILALHSISACEMALCGIESVIPFDEVVDALCETGVLMSAKLKESSEAGLCATKTACMITKEICKDKIN